MLLSPDQAALIHAGQASTLAPAGHSSPAQGESEGPEVIPEPLHALTVHDTWIPDEARILTFPIHLGRIEDAKPPFVTRIELVRSLPLAVSSVPERMILRGADSTTIREHEVDDGVVVDDKSGTR